MYSNGPGYVEPRANLTSVDLGTYAFFVISYLLANVTTEMTIWDTFVSLDIAVIQWITLCHKKSYNHTCNNTLARSRNVIDNVRVNNAFSH